MHSHKTTSQRRSSRTPQHDALSEDRSRSAAPPPALAAPSGSSHSFTRLALTTSGRETAQAGAIQMRAESASDAQSKMSAETAPNRTGLPDRLKSGIESLSGISMDNVRVHYKSAQPAQLSALAYAQGTDIHVAPGQERHLPHEAWHVVQQAQGRVRPTMQMKTGVPINDDAGLEHEADMMGAKALSMPAQLRDTAGAAAPGATSADGSVPSTENRAIATTWRQRKSMPVQRKLGFEFECGLWGMKKLDNPLTDQQKSGAQAVPAGEVRDNGFTKADVIFAGRGFNLKPDQGEDGYHIEFVVEPPVEESRSGRSSLKNSMDALKNLGDRLLSIPTPVRTSDGGVYFAGSAFGGSNDVLFIKRGYMEAEPQMTGGIRLDQLATVMEKMSATALPGETNAEHRDRRRGASYLGGKNPGETGIIAAAPGQARTGFTNFPGRRPTSPTTPSPELISLMALMISYLRMGMRNLAYAKTVAPLMARTNFAKLFDMIPEKNYYTSYPAEFRDMVLFAAGVAGTGATPFFSGASTHVDATDWGAIQAALSRGQWIEGVARNVDYLTEASFPDQTVAGYLFGLGGLGNRTETVGQEHFFKADTETEGAIFEFRRMTGHMHHYAWPDLAVELMDYIIGVNDLKNPSYTGKKVDDRVRKGR